MPVSILDSPNESIAGFHANISPAAGSNRYVYVLIFMQDGGDADPPSSVTLGGQAMTLLGGGNNPAGHDVALSVWFLNEAGIAAMSGTALAVSGQSGSGSASVWWSVQDADQTGPHTVIDATATDTSGNLSLARVADGYTGGASVQDATSGSALTNPTGANAFNFGAGNAAYGHEASTLETVDFTWANSFSRNNESVAWNIGPAGASGPAVTISDADDELFKVGDTVTVTGANFEAAQGSGRVVISPTDDIDDAGAQTQVVSSWSDTSIEFAASRGTMGVGSGLFLFVENDSGTSNVSGYAVQFEWKVEVVETLEDEAGSAVVSETAIKASIWRNREPTGAPDEELTGLTTSALGVADFEISNTGLSEDDPIYLALFKDDAVNWQASLVKIVPRYT